MTLLLTFCWLFFLLLFFLTHCTVKCMWCLTNFFITRKKMKVDSNVRNVWIQIGILNNFLDCMMILKLIKLGDVLWLMQLLDFINALFMDRLGYFLRWKERNSFHSYLNSKSIWFLFHSLFLIYMIWYLWIDLRPKIFKFFYLFFVNLIGYK